MDGESVPFRSFQFKRLCERFELLLAATTAIQGDTVVVALRYWQRWGIAWIVESKTCGDELRPILFFRGRATVLRDVFGVCSQSTEDLCGMQRPPESLKQTRRSAIIVGTRPCENSD